RRHALPDPVRAPAPDRVERQVYVPGRRRDAGLAALRHRGANRHQRVPDAAERPGGGGRKWRARQRPAAPAPPPQPPGSNMFYTDPQAVKDWGYNAIDATTQTAKHLIDAYYARRPDRSYFVGCSTSGRQGMAMSQLFPAYYDAIIAGDPFFVPPDISLSETWALQQIIAISPKDASGNPPYYEGFPLPDQNLSTTAILTPS